MLHSGLGSVTFFFFNGISTFMGNAKAILVEEQLYYLTHNWKDKGGGSYLSQGYLSKNECNSVIEI